VLVEAVKSIAAGQVHLDAAIAQRLAAHKVRGDNAVLANLSTREFEIFCLLAEGLSSSEIGKRLSLSAKTVANYSSQLKTKLEVTTVAELARLAIRLGILNA
jgi:DNA-binding NarL/FixJ family response regulator